MRVEAWPWWERCVEGGANMCVVPPRGSLRVTEGPRPRLEVTPTPTALEYERELWYWEGRPKGSQAEAWPNKDRATRSSTWESCLESVITSWTSSKLLLTRECPFHSRTSSPVMIKIRITSECIWKVVKIGGRSKCIWLYPKYCQIESICHQTVSMYWKNTLRCSISKILQNVGLF